MPSPRRLALALFCACALSLAFAAPAMAGDRATDPVGDGPRPGLDIVAVTTTVTDADVAFEVELADDWSYREDSLLYLFIGKTRPHRCGGWFADYRVALGSSGIAPDSSFAHAIGLAVDGPHVSIVVPLDGMRHPATIWFQVMTQDWNVVSDDPGAGIDLFPDPAPDQDWGMSCREVAVVSEVLPHSPSPAGAPARATAGSGSGPWLTILPVTVLVAAASLLAYDWMVAEQRWRRPVSRR